MTQDFTAFVGTVGIGGSGIWRSVDGGENWTVPKGIRDEFNCCALAVDPRNPDLVYAGLRDGIYRSEDRGVNFHRINCPINAYAVWSVAVDPSDSGTIFAGCRPGAVFRSSDGGERWEKLPVEFAPEGLFGGAPRVLAVAVDPTDSSMVWAGVEADGVRLSTDGGETWKRVGDRQIDSDIHGIAISPGFAVARFRQHRVGGVQERRCRRDLDGRGGGGDILDALLPGGGSETGPSGRGLRGKRRFGHRQSWDAP